MKVEAQQLKAFMIDAGLLSVKQFENSLKEAQKQGSKLEELLVNKGFVSADELNRLKAYILGIPFVNLENETIDSAILKIIPEAIARSHNIIAFRKSGGSLEVAMIDPEDLATIDFIKKKANLKILPRLTTPGGIKNALRQYQKTLQAEFGDKAGGILLKSSNRGFCPVLGIMGVYKGQISP